MTVYADSLNGHAHLKDDLSRGHRANAVYLKAKECYQLYPTNSGLLAQKYPTAVGPVHIVLSVSFWI